MNREEMESLVKQLEAAGLSEEQIMETFFETFQDGKMDREDLEALAEFMGYELTDGFKKDENPDPIEGGAEEGVDKAEAEDLKEIQPGESKEEFEEKIEEAKGEEKAEPEKPAEEEKSESIEEEKAEDGEEEVDEDKEWEEVQKKFHW